MRMKDIFVGGEYIFRPYKHGQRFKVKMLATHLQDPWAWKNKGRRTHCRFEILGKTNNDSTADFLEPSTGHNFPNGQEVTEAARLIEEPWETFVEYWAAYCERMSEARVKEMIETQRRDRIWAATAKAYERAAKTAIFDDATIANLLLPDPSAKESRRTIRLDTEGQYRLSHLLRAAAKSGDEECRKWATELLAEEVARPFGVRRNPVELPEEEVA